MATRLLCRASLRRNLPPVALGLTTGGLFMMRRQRPLLLDAVPPSTAAASQFRYASNEPPKERLDPEVIKQLSGGSLSGFAVGLLISVFSRTLVFLAGLTFLVVQTASRYGIDVVDLLKLKKRVQSSRILSALNDKTVFKLSFGITFLLSAFCSF